MPESKKTGPARLVGPEATEYGPGVGASDGPPGSWRWFVPARQGTFIARPNRFIALVDLEGETVTCHCPNPGRMGELLFPGTPVILEAAPPGRKTAWTLAAIIHRPLDGSRECVVPVAASRANQAVAALVLPLLFPGATRIKPEYAMGHSRFDFMVEEAEGESAVTETGKPVTGDSAALVAEVPALDRGKLPGGSGAQSLRRHLVEVKSVTEVEFQTACFPDAPSLRASRHLRELNDLAGDPGPSPGRSGTPTAAPGIPLARARPTDSNSRAVNDSGWTTHVVFAITHSRPRRLVPNLHTDPEFARTLSETAGHVHFHAVLLELDQEGWCRLAGPGLPTVRVDSSHGGLSAENRGNYFVTMELPADLDLEAGALGVRHLEKGWYVYCGSAAKNLRQRMARQIRKNGKARHWHLDWLVPRCRNLKAHGISTRQNLECLMARGLADLGAQGIKGFGSSDCGCASHLYHFGIDPLRDRGFQTLLMSLRHQTSLGD